MTENASIAYTVPIRAEGDCMGFAWVPFTETDTSFAARVTIRQTGQFGFTSGAINRHGIGDYTYAILYFDEQRRAIGIELTNEQKPGAIPIKKSPSNTYIRGKNFCDRYGIDYSKAYRFNLSEDKESGFLYFVLDDAEESEEDTETEKP